MTAALSPPPSASEGRWESPTRTRRIALAVALAIPLVITLACLQLTAASPAKSHNHPVIVRTGTAATPFITVSPHMESR